MQRLSEATLDQVRGPARKPAYDRTAVRIGVVHFGPGAFHRAHQAWYFDRMLAARPDFGICAVSLRTADLRNALAPQDGLYVLVEREADPAFQVIGSIREVVVAAERPEAVFDRLMTARLVTATVTEKGYCLGTGGELDLDHPDIARDRARLAAPASFPGWLVEALRRRRAAGLAPFTTISCDNLSDNGAKLRAAAIRLAGAQGDPGLAAWIAERAAFPCSMVDSITPASDDDLRARVADVAGVSDAWPVQRERFVQWVVEDRLGADGPAFAVAGVTLAKVVAPFERAKLRLLNGAHSTLAYVGLGVGHETVAQAMGDARLAGFVERMMRQDVAPTLDAPELDVPCYIGAVLQRFRNPAIVHRLSQIAWDGSQKLRFRLLETTAEALAADRPVARLAVGVAAWMRFVVHRTATDGELVDPLGATLREAASAADPMTALLALEGVFPPDLVANPRFRDPVAEAYVGLDTRPGVLLSL